MVNPREAGVTGFFMGRIINLKKGFFQWGENRNSDHH
jgi:hypothetical protein